MLKAFALALALAGALVTAAPGPANAVMPVNPAARNSQAARAFVADFYRWYFQADAETEVAVRNDAIYRYVAPQIVDELRGPYHDWTADYFTKTGMVSGDWREAKVVTQGVLPLKGDRFAVPVLFTLENRQYGVVVFLQAHGASYLITKVTDLYPHS